MPYPVRVRLLAGSSNLGVVSMITGRSGDPAAYHPFPLPGDRPVYAPDRIADIRHVRIEISELDMEAGAITATCTLRLAAFAGPLASVAFDAVDLGVSSVVDERGQSLAYDNDGRRLTVRLGRPLEEGRETELSISYRATPHRGLYFNRPDDGYPARPRQVWSQGQDQDNRHWFPCHDAPNHKQTSEMIITVPRGLFALSNGRLVSRHVDAGAGTETFHWALDVPHASYLVTLAAGDFAELVDEGGAVPLRAYVQRGREEDAARALARTPEMMRFFAERLNYPYPYPLYAQVFVADFIFGGMENTGATTLTDTALYDERAALDYDVDSLVAHELAHQWFGDLLTCREWPHAWLNEGFATYWEALFTEQHNGWDEFRYEMWKNANHYRDEDSNHYRRPLVERTYRQPIDIFDGHLYEKGSLVLDMLRHELGDERFFRAMQHYVHSNARRTVITSDLARAVEEATGRNLDWFFEQWAYHGGHPALDSSWSWNPDHNQAVLTVKQTQPQDSLTPLFRVSLDVVFHVRGHEPVPLRLPVQDKEHVVHVALPARPWLVQLDPGDRVLKSLNFERDEVQEREQLAEDLDVIGRIRAAQALGKRATPSAVAALARAVREDRFWGVQAEAARALGAARTTAARDALVSLMDIAHPKARRGVVDALGAFKGDGIAAAALSTLLRRGDSSYFVEAEAAKSLGRTRIDEALETLTWVMAEKESWEEVIRRGALDGMGELRDRRAIPLLMQWTRPGKNQIARGAAVAALAKLARGEDKDDLVERLTDLLEDDSFRVLMRTIPALKDIGSESAIPALERLAARHLDGRVVRACRVAIRDIRAGTSRDSEVASLRDRLEAIEQQNRELRDRLAALEARGTPA